MELGVYTFVENTPDPATGKMLEPAQRLRDLIEEYTGARVPTGALDNRMVLVRSAAAASSIGGVDARKSGR